MYRSVAPAVLAPLLSCAPFIPQTKGITEQFFLDPDVELTTPAFRKSSGFTRHGELVAYLEELRARGKGRVEVESVGASQQGRDIPMVLLGGTSTTSKPLRVWFQGGLHGNEPASSEGLLELLRALVDGPDAAELLAEIRLAVVPVANVDGYEVQRRTAVNGLDLNRDQTKLLAPETRLLKRAFNRFRPHVAIDFHEYRPYRRDFVRFGRRGITQIYDVMFLYSGNLNVPEALRRFIREIYVAKAAEAVESRGLRQHDYITTRDIYGETHFNRGSTNARSSATSFALANTVAALVEVRGVGLDRAAFKRRVMTTYWVARSFLDTAAREREATRETLQLSASPTPSVVVRSRRAPEHARIRAIDVADEKEIELDVRVRNALASKPVLQRARPYAYVLKPDAAPEVQRLEVLGLSVARLSKDRSLTAQAFRVVEHTRAPYRQEGVRRQDVRTELFEAEVDFPAGSFVVRMDQPRAPLAAETLEPEMDNSFVAWGVQETSEGAVLPVYRVMSPFDID
ncbi:MAG: M14 family metallocarboxypeptidase [Myxococcota bacterium]